MSFADLWIWIEEQPLSAEIGATWWFPLFESIHVLASTFVVGTIVTVDLRLLGLIARAHPVSRIVREVIPWTRAAFVVAAVTGAAMFITQASRYADNRAFQIKVGLLVLAGLNMAAFHSGTFRNVDRWDLSHRGSAAGVFAGACSLLLWIGIMLSGRWVGHL